MTLVSAKLKYLRISPRKVRAVADVLKNLSVSEAEARLMVINRRPAVSILKLLKSAEANAKNNFKMDPTKLYIKEIKVEGGPSFKRWQPRARGAVNMIKKRTSHISIILNESLKPQPSRFIFKEKTKKKTSSKSKTKKTTKEKETEKEFKESQIKTSAKGGFLKRIFRRKSI